MDGSGITRYGLSENDILDIWRSVVDSMPHASDEEKAVSFALAILSARAIEL